MKYNVLFVIFVLQQPTAWVVIDRYGNFHLTDIDTDMLIITDAYTDTHKKKTNLPIKRKGIQRYRCWYRYKKSLDTDTKFF